MHGLGKAPSRPLVAALLAASLFVVLAGGPALTPLVALAAPARVHPHPSPTPPPPTPPPTPPPPQPSPTPLPTVPAPLPPSPAATVQATSVPSQQAQAAAAASTGSDPALPGVVLPRTGAQAEGAPAADYSLLVWILVLGVAGPGTLLMALIALVLVRR